NALLRRRLQAIRLHTTLSSSNRQNARQLSRHPNPRASLASYHRYTAVVPIEFQSLHASLAHVLQGSTDVSHDLSHIERVWRNALAIAAEEGSDLKLLAAPVL